MNIARPNLLNRIIAAKHNGFVKILTGIRRCGKSHIRTVANFDNTKLTSS